MRGPRIYPWNLNFIRKLISSIFNWELKIFRHVIKCGRYVIFPYVTIPNVTIPKVVKIPNINRNPAIPTKLRGGKAR